MNAQSLSDIPAQMKAIVIDGKGGPEVLKEAQVDVPKPGSGEVLIAVKAAGVNRPDVFQRQGNYPAPPGHSMLPGLEVSGIIVAVASDVSHLKVGDEVMALVNGGGYAQFVVADAGATLLKPEHLSFAEAAAMPETFFTVWHNVFERGALKANEAFLVHGGTSGIGVTAIQLAHAFGARVFTTAGSDEKCAACLKFGADHAINYKKEDFVDVIKKETNKKGVDVILDMVGGDYIERNIRSLNEDGRLVNIAFLSGSSATVEFRRVMLKRLTLTGSTLRVRSKEVKAEIAQNLAKKVIPLLGAGKVKIVIDSTFPLAEACKAHERIDSSGHIGKIVLLVD